MSAPTGAPDRVTGIMPDLHLIKTIAYGYSISPRLFAAWGRVDTHAEARTDLHHEFWVHGHSVRFRIAECQHQPHPSFIRSGCRPASFVLDRRSPGRNDRPAPHRPLQRPHLEPAWPAQTLFPDGRAALIRGAHLFTELRRLVRLR